MRTGRDYVLAGCLVGVWLLAAPARASEPWLREGRIGAEASVGTTELAFPFPSMDLSAWLTRLMWAALASSLVGLAALAWAMRRGQRFHLPSEECRLAGQVPLTARSRVALLHVAGHRIVVGHDPSGIQSMILLPEGFPEIDPGDVLDEKRETPASPPSDRDEANVPRRFEGARMEPRSEFGFKNVEDSGWDLNRMTWPR